MTESVDSFRPLIEREVRGVPSFTVKDAILRACRQFCVATHAWKEYLDDMPAIANIKQYDLDPPTYAQVVTVLGIRHRDRDLEPKTIDQLVREHHNWRDMDAPQARYWTQESPTTFTLVPYPSESVMLGIKNIRVALKPKMDATEVGDILFNDYEEVIAHGALAILQAIPDKPWTNGAASGMHRDLFDEGVSEARIRARKDYSRAELYSRANHRFGGP